jgi:hypothetical protein
MKLVVMKKSTRSTSRLQRLRERRSESPDDKLEYFRKLILDHLDSLQVDDVMSKSGKALPVGTIRDRKGGFKYIKIAPNKWVKKYDGHSRGAKMAIAAIRRKVAAAKDAHEMMQIILQHRDRFSDKEGHPLPFVQELHNYIMSEQDSREKARQGKTAAEDKKEGAKSEENKKDNGGVKEWEQRGRDDFKAGKPRKVPYNEIVIPGMKIGSPESREADKKMEAWLRGWDRANFSSDESQKEPEKKPGKEDQVNTHNLAQEGKAAQPTGEGGGSQVNTPERGAEGKTAKEKISPEQQAEVKKKLENLAVPMMEVGYSKDEYNRLFPEGIVKTPLKTVKMGSDQFAKLGRKDSGGRQSYIGAAYQTLTDPIVVIKEGNDDVYIKSFTGENGIKTFVSIEKDKEDGRFIVTNYRRKEQEILKKIKRADSIAYIADDRGSPAGGNEGKPLAGEGDNHLSIVSPDSPERSSQTPAKIGKLSLEGLTHEENIYSDSYYTENPAYNGANTGFYLPEYDRALNSAAEKFANSVMEGKPKKRSEWAYGIMAV